MIAHPHPPIFMNIYCPSVNGARPCYDESTLVQVIAWCRQATSLYLTLQWRRNERDSVSNHRHLDGFLNRLFRPISKKTSKIRVTGLCEGNPPVTDGFPSQNASNAEKVSIWWRHHGWCWPRSMSHMTSLGHSEVSYETMKCESRSKCTLFPSYWKIYNSANLSIRFVWKIWLISFSSAKW